MPLPAFRPPRAVPRPPRMTNSLRLARSLLVPPILAVVAFFSTGCGGDEGIQSYRVPRTAAPTEKAAPGGATGYRILGAMYPADDPAWFFKLTGPAEQVAKFEADFDKLAASVQIKDGASLPTFSLPAGWSLGGRKSIHAETIKLPGSTLEVTVTASAGGAQPNVKRWADQVGQAGVPVNFTKTFDAASGKGLRVDVTGPKNPSGGPMMGRGK